MRLRAFATLGFAAVLSVAPACAVVILDSTWAKEGGTDKSPSLGFRAHIALANEPQFRSVVAFTSDGDTWRDCSGTWIGNADGHAYVLTHVACFAGRPATMYGYRTTGGSVLTGEQVIVQPDGSNPLAIVRLSEPITDAGPQPLLYNGEDLLGRTVTFVGSGERGIGSAGEAPAFYGEPSEKDQLAAGQGRIDSAAVPGDAGLEDAFGIYLPKEDGSLNSRFEGPATPVSSLAAAPATGDGGAAGWIQLNDGRWAIAGVVRPPAQPARYGAEGIFESVSTNQDWIDSVLSTAVYGGQ